MRKRIVSGIAAVVLTFSGAGTALTNIADLTFDVAAHAEDTSSGKTSSEDTSSEDTSSEDTSSEDTSSGEDHEETFATEGTCGENLTWVIDEEGTLTISGEGEMYDYTDDGDAPWNADEVKNVVIGDGVTSIGECAFLSCDKIENVTIPDSVTKIGSEAFLMCTSLESVTIPESVTSIDRMAFGYDFDFDTSEFSKLENFKINCYIGSAGEQYAADNGFDYELIGNAPGIPVPAVTPGIGCVTLRWKAIENAEKYAVAVEVDGKWTLVEKTTDTSYVLKHLNEDTEYKVAIIAMFNGKWNKDFSGAKTVSPVATSGTCGEDLTWKLDKDGTLTISGTGDMDSYPAAGTAPWSVNEVKNVVISDGVTSIGDEAFYDCAVLESINIPGSVKSIGARTFTSCESLESIIIPDSVTSIGYGTFAFCTGLKNINIPDGVTNISGCAFFACKKLESVTIPDSVTSIGYGAFAYCSVLGSITLPDSVTNIDEFAFDNCKSLTSINIPDGVTNLGEDAFQCCSSLESIVIPDGIMYIGNNTFYNCASLKSVKIGNGVTSIGKFAFADCTSLESLTIPDSVENIGYGAFDACSSLKSAELGTGVKEIGEFAFYDCESLTIINIPDGVTSIGEVAFAYCTSLESMTIPDSVTSIGEFAFYDCESLTIINIPDGVTSIGEGAFYFCNSLTSVTVPKTVTSIGEFALGYYDDGNPEPGHEIKVENYKIYCYKGTAGEQYAIDNGFDYELIDETPANPVPTAAPGDSCAMLEWEAVENAEKYAVAVEADGKWTAVAKTSDTSYVLKGLKAGTEYNVAIIAMFDGKWNKDFSNAITVTPNEAVSEYPTVTNIDHSEKYHQFRLTWNAVEGAEKYGIAVKLGGKWKVQAYTDKTEFTSPKLKEGSTVEMVICAKVNGKWDTSNLDGRAFEVTVE